MITRGSTGELLARMEEAGYRGGIVAVQRLQELREDIEGRFRAGMFDEGLYREYLLGFDSDPHVSQ